METFRIVARFFARRYWVFLLLIVLFSFGQILGMYVWKDDNAIFFKFTHLSEPAGYLGKGLFGEGTYKFSVTPYWFIYQIFGYESIVPFYVLILIFYFFATFAVYRLFAQIVSENVGKLAGFLFASGYIASEGFMWLASSMIQSVSIILSSITLILYNLYSIKGKIHLFFTSLLFYFITIQITPVRVHYFILVLAVFDFLWVRKDFRIKSLLFFLLRIFAFGFVFFWSYLKSSDQRVALQFSFVRDLLNGEIYKLYSFLGSLGYLFLPDRQVKFLVSLIGGIVKDAQSTIVVAQISVFILTAVFLYFVTSRRKYINLFFILLNLIWLGLVNLIIKNPYIAAGKTESVVVFIGGLVLEMLLVVIFTAEKKIRSYIVFFTIWLLGNLFAYTSYQPTSILPSFDRYLAHSFVPLVGLLALVASVSRPDLRQFKLIPIMLVILWGMSNIFNSISSQHEILIKRSQPARMFYQQLKSYLPVVNKGDIFYFDVADDAQGYFESAFSVGQMPETTALAWRYGIDRYDILLFTNFSDLADHIYSKNLTPEKIHTFWYSKNGLIDTSSEFRKQFFEGSDYKKVSFESSDNGTILIKEPVSSITPIEIKLDILANPQDSSLVYFPYMSLNTGQANSLYTNNSLKKLAIQYRDYKNGKMRRAIYSASSEWRERKIRNINDQNPETVWQVDRVLWQKKNESLKMDLGEVEEINRFIWINGFADNTPTRFRIEVSLDGVNWQVAREINSIIRIDTKNPQVVEFDPHKARFVRITFHETLGGDSPAIAEAWVIPTLFSDLDILETESFLKAPFGYVTNVDDWNILLSNLKSVGEAQIYWQSNNKQGFITTTNQKIDLYLDNTLRSYSVVIPAGGTKITQIKISDCQIPCEVTVHGIRFSVPRQ